MISKTPVIGTPKQFEYKNGTTGAIETETLYFIRTRGRNQHVYGTFEQLQQYLANSQSTIGTF